MKIGILKVGRIAYPEIRVLARIYEDRLKPFSKVQGIEVKDDAAAIKFLRSLSPGQRVLLLDERGPLWTSPQLAQNIRSLSDDPSVKSLTFVIAGPMGPATELRSMFQETWSLSKATLTSDMAWLLVWEQVYRAFSILKGTGYHHD